VGNTYLSSRNLSSANGPDRFIRDNDLAPLLGLDSVGNSAELSRNNLGSNTHLPLLKALSTAEDNIEASLNRSAGLGTHKLVALAKDGPPLGVAKDHPFDPGVPELLRDYLARVLAFVEDVLRRDFDVFAQELQHEEEVERGGRDDDLWRCLLAAGSQAGLVRCSCRLQEG
jgi:hypothetical protein